MAYADFSSSSVLVKPAVEMGTVDVFVNAKVREVFTNGEGEATAVSYIDKEDLRDYEVKAKVVILAASACSSARILLNPAIGSNLHILHWSRTHIPKS